MAFLTKEEIKSIISKAPAGTSPEGIVASLRQRGHHLEGWEDVSPETVEPTVNLSVLTQGTAEPGQVNFVERLKAGFGGEKAKARGRKLEEQAGLRGRPDIGDIADIAGATLPVVGGIVGGLAASPTALFSGPIGPTGGATIGAASGEAVRRFVGSLLGTREGEGRVEEAADIVTDVAQTGAFTYLGGKTLEVAGRLPGVKQAVRYLTEKLPERLFSSFFKTTADDLTQQVRTGALARLQTENPELFKKYIQEGIVKLGSSGKVEVNPTLARQALEKSFGSKETGRSLEKMAEYSYLKQFELELAARNTVRNSGVVLDLGKDKAGYVRMLKDVKSSFGKEGYGFLGKMAQEADSVLKQLTSAKNSKVPAELALQLRRTIDSLRSASSFRTSTTLAPKQAIFKTAADKLRARLGNEVPGLRSVMKDYKFFIDSADGLVAEAARRGNNRIFSLFDAVVGGSSIAGNIPGAGLGLLAGLRTVQTPAILTFIGRQLQEAPRKVVGIGATVLGQAGKVVSNRQREETRDKR